jgi:hypothetical protein
MFISQQMDHIPGLFVYNDSMGVALQTTLSDDDDHPPSSWRTVRCAFTFDILPAWVRKA